MKDFYYILGTTTNASPSEIEAAYQKLARKFRLGGEEQDEFIDARFREISEAYDTLRDARRRGKYDAAIKKNQNRQLAAFKLKYLNIAITLTFLVTTFLFAVYVIRTIHGRPPKKAVQKQPAEVLTTLAQPKKHRKISMHSVKGPLTAADTSRKRQPQIIPAIRQQTSSDSTYIATLHANITGIVYLHQAPDYNSAVLAKIPDAAKVRVLENADGWCKVSFKTQSGYVLKSAVERL